MSSSSACLRENFDGEDDDLTLAQRYPALARDVEEAIGVEVPSNVDEVIACLLRRTELFYMNDGKIQGVPVFPLPRPLSPAANDEMAAFVEDAGLEGYLTGSMDC